MIVVEVTMRLVSGRAPSLKGFRSHPGWFSRWLLPGAVAVGMLTLAGFAQLNQPPPRTPKPVLLPEANRPPDVNQQMEMREKNAQRRNFDAANAERLKQMTQATDMLETLAMALKAEVDNTGSGALSENAVHKAEAIEKLAHSVKERMTLTLAPQ